MHRSEGCGQTGIAIYHKKKSSKDTRPFGKNEIQSKHAKAHASSRNQIVNPESTVILSDSAILECIDKGEIKISPFRRECLGSNSYEVHLGRAIAIYKDSILDAKKANSIEHFQIPSEGMVLYPGEFYLGVTEEYTETLKHVPFLEGKSSVGRLGIDIHATAGKGDVGFCNFWTLEISVKKPVRVYAGMPVGQLIYFNTQGEILTPYNVKTSAKYNEKTPRPVESMMWKNTF